MDMLEQIAQRIIGETSGGNGLHADELSEIVGNAAGREVNCYPGKTNSGCHPQAFFISLSNPRYAKARTKHLKFSQVLEKLVQHMTGECTEITQHAIVITDTWDEVAFEKWHSTIENMQHVKKVEIFLLANGILNRIKIAM